MQEVVEAVWVGLRAARLRRDDRGRARRCRMPGGRGSSYHGAGKACFKGPIRRLAIMEAEAAAFSKS